MENSARYTIVGFFIFVFTTGIVLYILWVSKYDMNTVNSQLYKLYTKESVSGLKKNASVYYKGLTIGLVKDIKINPDNQEEIEISILVSQPALIKEDSYAIIDSEGISGIKHIAIKGGSEESKNLKIDSDGFGIVPLRKSFFAKLENDAQNITKKVDTLLTRINLLLNEQNVENIGNILANTKIVTKNFHLQQKSLNKLLENIDKLLSTSNIDKISNSLQSVNNTTKNFEDITLQINHILKTDVREILNNIKDSSQQSQNMHALFYKLETTLESIDNAVDNISQNPGDMIFKTREINYGPGETIKESQ